MDTQNTHLGTAGVLDLQEDLWPASFALGGQILIANIVRLVPSGRLEARHSGPVL